MGIPTVSGRVVPAAVRMVIEPIFENRFAEHSHGFRPGRGCKDALRRVEELLRAGRPHVVEVDIKGYFKHAKASQLGELDGWVRMRLRSIPRKRRGLEGRGRGIDHQRWSNRYFKKPGLFCLRVPRETEYASLRNGADC